MPYARMKNPYEKPKGPRVEFDQVECDNCGHKQKPGGAAYNMVKRAIQNKYNGVRLPCVCEICSKTSYHGMRIEREHENCYRVTISRKEAKMA